MFDIHRGGAVIVSSLFYGRTQKSNKQPRQRRQKRLLMPPSGGTEGSVLWGQSLAAESVIRFRKASIKKDGRIKVRMMGIMGRG